MMRVQVWNGWKKSNLKKTFIIIIRSVDIGHYTTGVLNRVPVTITYLPFLSAMTSVALKVTLLCMIIAVPLALLLKREWKLCKAHFLLSLVWSERHRCVSWRNAICSCKLSKWAKTLLSLLGRPSPLTLKLAKLMQAPIFSERTYNYDVFSESKTILNGGHSTKGANT